MGKIGLTKKQKRYANKLDENHADQGEDLLNDIINPTNIGVDVCATIDAV